MNLNPVRCDMSAENIKQKSNSAGMKETSQLSLDSERNEGCIKVGSAKAESGKKTALTAGNR